MELLAENSTLSLWLMQYGCFAIFGLLVVGIIAFPVPEETLMVLAGILMSQGNLSIPSTLLAAFLGSVCGISISYSIGRTAGHYVIHTFGKWIGLTEKRLQKAHAWTERFGTWTLFIGYFIPGLRHFTGFLAGTTDLEFNRFARFAYSGALLWILTFLSVGYFFGDYCVAFLSRFGSL